MFLVFDIRGIPSGHAGFRTRSVGCGIVAAPRAQNLLIAGLCSHQLSDRTPRDRAPRTWTQVLAENGP
jgi:hypothetical protein